MSDSNTLFPEGYGLKRVNPQLAYLGGQALGDFSGASSTVLTGFSAKGLMSAAAGVWQAVLDVASGSGYFDGAILGNASANSVASPCALRVTIDGTAFDVTTSSSSNSSAWATPCDITIDSANRRVALIPLRIPFQNSLKVEVMRGSADTFAWGVLHALEF